MTGSCNKLKASGGIYCYQDIPPNAYNPGPRCFNISINSKNPSGLFKNPDLSKCQGSNSCDDYSHCGSNLD